MSKTSVRIVMDVEPEVKAALKENADKTGLSLTYYLAYCGLSKEPKAMPPEEIVKAKNLLCDIHSRLCCMRPYFDKAPVMENYIDETKALIEQFDRLLLEVQR